MRGYRSILATILLSGVASLAGAQPDATIDKPAVKVGDTWTYRRINLWTNQIVGATTATVTHVGPNAIHVVTTQPDSPMEGDTISTAEWNTVATGSAVNTPHAGTFSFPLSVGKSYSANHVWENSKTGRRLRHERVAKVVGWDEIIVPAGRFRALKIDVQGPSQRLDAFGTGRTQTTLWYVPEVRRWVKSFYEDAAGNKEGTELVQFKLQ